VENGDGETNRNQHSQGVTMNIFSTKTIEDKYLVSFGKRTPVTIERGSGVYVWDTEGKQYLDFTAGWAVTAIGHAHPVHIAAINEQASRICQNPDGSLTYAPPRARLLKAMVSLLPEPLHNIFFSNSGAEANDAALKLARKITGRKKVVSTRQSFHGRTIGTTSVTGQAIQRERYKHALNPDCVFIPYNDSNVAREEIDHETAAVIIEPVQGEGGVWVAESGYLTEMARLCKKKGALLIVDEIQTGFWRTGPSFASLAQGVQPDFMTLAKGIAGGFPFGAVVVKDEVARRIEMGDHGGTYCGNPLGCAVAAATIEYLKSVNIGSAVEYKGNVCAERLGSLQQSYPTFVNEVRGKGLLWAIDFYDEAITDLVVDGARESGLLLNQKHGRMIRLFPALTITAEELRSGLRIIEKQLEKVVAPLRSETV
jgi:acetylornithine/N-succinyldiaminopimelate aminotransferase